MGNDPKDHMIEVVLERNGASTSVLLAFFAAVQTVRTLDIF